MTEQTTREGSNDFASLTPRRVVEELDKYIVGQGEAKKAVAIALRNRWRRQNVEPDLRDEILPNNIIMIGPTGVGKTEIARRLSRLAGAPFIKVEASKFTEVGYVGRDVESMVRDLVDIAVNMVRSEKEGEFRDVAADRVEERLLDLLLPPLADGDSKEARQAAAAAESARTFVVGPTGPPHLEAVEEEESLEGRRRRTREKLRGLLKAEKLEDREVEVEVSESAGPTVDVGAMGMEGMDFNIGEMIQDMLPKRTRRRMVTVAEARRILLSEETDKLIDMDEVVDEAVARAEHMGIIFLDELDKVAGSRQDQGPDVSREGVQRDLLPIVEGSTVQTRYGMVGTEHILFIAAGAFHVSRPSDLIPELQGRFPIRVELHSLGQAEFVRILLEPKNALLTQYMALVATEGAELEFTDDAIQEIARIAADVNQSLENIGARRLHTVLTTLLEDVMFNLPDPDGPLHFVVDAQTVRERLARIVEDDDLRRYIL
ncbi:MAG: ATP-dependent protease ATPase subunit HslU [Gemmatimonadetes bacterium]|nr:ATP-dependent protease ATPase subunit HslU [Gemmatimonadota bacterium]